MWQSSSEGFAEQVGGCVGDERCGPRDAGVDQHPLLLSRRTEEADVDHEKPLLGEIAHDLVHSVVVELGCARAGVNFDLLVHRSSPS